MNEPPESPPGHFVPQGQFPPPEAPPAQGPLPQGPPLGQAPGQFPPPHGAPAQFVPPQGGFPAQGPPQDQFLPPHGAPAQFVPPQGGFPAQGPPQDQFVPQFLPPPGDFSPHGPFPGQFAPQGPPEFLPQDQFPPQGEYPPAYPQPGGPMWGAPPPRRSRAKMWTIVGVVAALVVGGGVTAGVLIVGSGDSGAGPDKVVSAYLNALANGDAAGALKAGPPPGSTTFLTNEILAKQQAKAKITNIKVGQVEKQENEARVPVAYQFGSKNVDDDFFLRKTTGKWQLETTATGFDVSEVHDIPGLTLFGKPVQGKKIFVFPGPLEFGSSNPDLTVTDKSSDDFATTPTDSVSPFLDTGLSPAGRKKVVSAVGAKLIVCARVKTTEPAQCPQKVFDFEAVPGTATWRLASNVSRVLQANLENGLTVQVTGEMNWSVSYKAKDFDNKISVRHDTDETYISAQVDLSKSPPTCTLSGY